jgi:small subunit ribosomal protein S35
VTIISQKKKKFKMWMVIFIFSNWCLLVSLDYLHLNDMCCNPLSVNLLGDDEFRSLDLSPNKSLNMRSYGRKVYKRAAVHPPCSTKMPTDQDWPSVWPVARSFHPASVPLPLHQGWVVSWATPPDKLVLCQCRVDEDPQLS